MEFMCCWDGETKIVTVDDWDRYFILSFDLQDSPYLVSVPNEEADFRIDVANGYAVYKVIGRDIARRVSYCKLIEAAIDIPEELR